MECRSMRRSRAEDNAQNACVAADWVIAHGLRTPSYVAARRWVLG